MSAAEASSFPGFPSVGRGTSIPNVFFSAILPNMESPGDLLAFLWVSRFVQEQRGDARFVTAEQLWNEPGVSDSFKGFGMNRDHLDTSLRRSVDLGALLSLTITGRAGPEVLFLLNTPASRKTVARAAAGEIRLKPATIVIADATPARPDTFRLYEEHIGTITPLVAARLAEAEQLYPGDQIKEAFEEAAVRNIRNWRYVERILQNWSEGGARNEASGRDSVEARRRYYLGED